METYTDGILTYLAKLSRNTQICKQEACKEQNKTLQDGGKKIDLFLKREKLQNSVIVFGMRMSKIFTLCTAERTVKGQTPRLTEYTKAEDNFYESHNCTSYCWQYKLSMTTPLRHIAGVEVYLHSFLTSALEGEGC